MRQRPVAAEVLRVRRPLAGEDRRDGRVWVEAVVLALASLLAALRRFGNQ